MTTIILAYPWGGFAADSTLTVGTDLTFGKAEQLVADGLARWGSGAAPVANPANVELGYAESVVQFSTTSTTPVAVTGITTTVNVGTRPIMVKAWDQVTFGSAASNITVELLEDGTAVGTLLVSSTAASDFVPWVIQRRRAPTAGLHTYSLSAATTAGTAAINGFAIDRTCIQVTQL